MPNEIAWGFHQLQDIFDERVTDANIPVVMNAIEQSARQYDMDLTEMLNWVEEWTGYPKHRVELDGGGELQPVSQDGVPLPRRGGSRYEVAYPLMRGADSFGFNAETYAKATVAEMNRRMLRVEKADAAWNIRRLLAAIFTNVNWTYTDDNDDIGELTIKGLANNDTDKYVNLNGELITDNHYSAQANDIGDNDDPFGEMYEDLYEHPENSGPYVMSVASNLSDDIEGLSNFVKNPNLTPFVEYGVNTNLASAAVDEYLGFGNRVLGAYNEWIVVESRRIPAGYMVGVATGAGKFIRRRQHAEPSLQGLQMAMHSPNSNFKQFDFYRRAGYGVFNRIAAVVRRIGDASYAIPSGYDARTLKG